MSQESGPTLTVPVNMVDLGVLAVATSNVASFAVTANAGVLGDEVMFRVSCTDGVVTTDSVLDLVLGQRGWTVLPLDPGGDTLPGGLLDLREIRWRIDGDWLEVEIRSATDFDSSELAMELWMDNVGSQWQEHAVTIDNGLGTVWGLLSNGFNELDDAFLVFVGTDTVRIRMDTTEMDLGEDAVQLAVGSGFCGTDALYCDAAPDDWGNPYSGPLDFSLWYTLDW